MPMTLLHTYLQAHAQGIALVEAASQLEEKDLTALGADPTTTKNLLALAKIYFGDTSFSQYQTQCIGTSHNLTTLLAIERYVSRIKTTRNQWVLRVKLCQTPEQHIAHVAKQYMPSTTPKEGIRIRRRDNGAPMTVSLTGASTILSDFVSALDADQPIASLNALLSGNAVRPQTQTHIIIPLDKLDKVTQGDNDVIVHTSHGATMTGAEFVQRTLEDEGFATLVSPVQGAINLYRTRRFASTKQRIMLQAQSHSCAWPGCRKPIDKCQPHHIVAWKYGGNTNIDNLVPLCPYHNGINDDYAAAHNSISTRRGWVTKYKGKPTWSPPQTITRN
ncbi:HNH endonuclease [Corynebacterium sp. sy039]|nr:HNH endonuclease [Corynebacterium sp. sy039]